MRIACYPAICLSRKLVSSVEKYLISFQFVDRVFGDYRQHSSGSEVKKEYHLSGVVFLQGTK